MYRFRSTDDLLEKHQELENQEIYFSEIASLNDPMEGFREYYWSGDIIVRRNFFKHYLLCLEYLVSWATLVEADYSLSSDDIPIFISEASLPTDLYRQNFKEICNDFFNTEGVNEYIELLAMFPWKLSRDEVYWHLRVLHVFAFNSVIEFYNKHGLQATPFDHPNNLKIIINALKKFNLEDKKTQEEAQLVFNISKDIMMEIDLITAAKFDPVKKRDWFLITEFPELYLNQILKLAYPEAYVSCFMGNCSNAVVWSHYGDGHKGVCLKFKTKENNGIHFIDLYCITGFSSSGDVYGYRPFQFKKIDYSNQFTPINFFESIGRLPVGQLMSQWYSDIDGNISQSAINFENQDAKEKWRRNYWNNFDKDYNLKLKDWEYENEYRLLLSDGLGFYNELRNRKLKYKFEDLEAIIFGIRTPMEDKIKLIRIIYDKCKENNRTNFDFFQAYYSSSSGNIQIRKMDLIKFK